MWGGGKETGAKENRGMKGTESSKFWSLVIPLSLAPHSYGNMTSYFMKTTVYVWVMLTKEKISDSYPFIE